MENNDEKQILSKQITFSLTDNIERLGIKEFIVKDRDFLIKWSDERNSCIEFKKPLSLSQNIKLIRKTLKNDLKNMNIDIRIFEIAIKDIEDELIKRRNEIFNLNNKQTTSNELDNKFKMLLLISFSIGCIIICILM